MCIFINQLREKIGVMFGPSETTTGGNALKFYASVRIDIRPSTAIKDGDNTLGRLTKVKVVKNKVAPPFKRCEFDIMFGEGISKAGEIIDLGVDTDVIQKSGSWFSYNGQKLAQGREAAKQLMYDNPELAEELEAKIMEALAAADADKSKPKPKAKSKSAKTADEAPEKAPADPADNDVDDVDLDFDEDDDFTLEEDL